MCVWGGWRWWRKIERHVGSKGWWWWWMIEKGVWGGRQGGRGRGGKGRGREDGGGGGGERE